ncbi:MAG: type II secretion system protein N [Alphaproteobacteria bacterium]
MIRTLTVRRLAAFGRWLPNDIYFWLKAVLLALVAIQAARLFWVVVVPVGPFGEWRPAPPRLLSPEAQAAIVASVDPFFRPGAMQQATSAPAIDLQLLGTRAGEGSLPGSAILGSADGEQKSYLVGEEVAPGVKLADVFFDHVVLKRGGATQTIYMPQTEGAASAGHGAAGAAAASAVGNAFQLKPRKQGERVTGALVSPGADQRLFAAAGFREGDVIVAVNGAQITSMIDVQQLQSSIAPGARLLLTVERGAAKVPIALNLPSN